MMSNKLNFVYLCIVFMMQSLLGSVPAWSAPRIVPGQIIVKFSPNSDMAQAVAEAHRHTPADLDVLQTILKPFHDRVRAPLQPLRFMGNEQILFAINTNQVTDNLKKQLMSHDSIETVHDEHSSSNDRPLLSKTRMLKVAFVEDSHAWELLAKSLTTAQPTDSLDKLLSHLQENIHIPIHGKLSEADALLIWVDLTHLTLSLIDRLHRDPDIESAQPNYRLTFQ